MASCSVCNKDATGAHSCIICQKIVHMICGTLAPGAEEGYGAKIVCFNCDSTNATVSDPAGKCFAK